ncbi:hypothetical protein Y032_0202g1794 [Ancylostoma ceylanicum]|uniref:Uncharacterized protein n=1 Tax=Ancylostoma ceylanicum TaxID=53326 RepID=A0A016SMD9_9BILA|nr:hypothetical protein Y032_0202g1794 [Ancylostoma ceylanicum]
MCIGKPYHSEISDEEKLCHHLAYYDKDANQCKCYTPENDMLKTTLFPLTVTEKSSREGEKCLDCSGGGSNDIVILIDISLNIDDLRTITFDGAQTGNLHL